MKIMRASRNGLRLTRSGLASIVENLTANQGITVPSATLSNLSSSDLTNITLLMKLESKNTFYYSYNYFYCIFSWSLLFHFLICIFFTI